MPLKRFLWRRCKVLVSRHTLVLPTGNLAPLYVRPWLHIGLVFVIFQGLRNLLRNLLFSFMSDLYFRHCTFNKVSLFCILFGMVNVSWTWIDSSISFGNFLLLTLLNMLTLNCLFLCPWFIDLSFQCSVDPTCYSHFINLSLSWSECGSSTLSSCHGILFFPDSGFWWVFLSSSLSNIVIPFPTFQKKFTYISYTDFRVLFSCLFVCSWDWFRIFFKYI